MFDYNSRSRVAWSRDPAVLALSHIHVNEHHVTQLLRFAHCQKCSILHFPVLRLKGELDHLQNLNSCSLYHCRAILKISSKSVNSFLSNVANRETDRQTNKQANKVKTLSP